MIPKANSKNYLAMAMALIIVATPIAFFGTQEARDSRAEKKTVQAYQEETPYKNYKEENIDKLAQKYGVEEEFLYYLADVEMQFNLDPYELMALIAWESEFRPVTHMDGGSLSYNITQMKFSTAKTAYMAITEYYGMDITYPTHELLAEDKYYAALLAGGYLKYLHDKYQDRYEAYTAYRWGITGRIDYYNRNGNYQSPYALSIVELKHSFSREGKV